MFNDIKDSSYFNIRAYDEDEADAHLEGATPTRFGPKPLKSERGPSFSNINLHNKQTH